MFFVTGSEDFLFRRVELPTGEKKATWREKRLKRFTSWLDARTKAIEEEQKAAPAAAEDGGEPESKPEGSELVKMDTDA